MRRRRIFSTDALPGAHPACYSHLLAPCAASLLCMIASSPPNRCYAHLLGTVAVAMASSRHPSRCLPGPPPPQAHEFHARPAVSARQRFAPRHPHRDSASSRSCHGRACALVLCADLAIRFASHRTPPSGRRRSAGPFHQLRTEQVVSARQGCPGRPHTFTRATQSMIPSRHN